MTAKKEMTVSLVGHTRFDAEVAYDVTGFEGDQPLDLAEGEGDYQHGGSHLAEFAGRACYQSFDRPNPATATNALYLAHIQEVKHTSVMEHGSMSFYIQHVSRSLTHELVRHRHLSYSQESQRYVRLGDHSVPVIPPLFQTAWEWDDHQPISETQGIVEDIWARCVKSYNELVDIWEHRLAMQGVNGTERKKRAREAARCVLPNMTPTSIVVTGNHTAWRHFLRLRGSMMADVEIRRLAVIILAYMVQLEPALYQDFSIREDGDGAYILSRD